jgi:hypothetical protein
MHHPARFFKRDIIFAHALSFFAEHWYNVDKSEFEAADGKA